MRRVPPAKRYSRLFLPLIFLAACLINTVAVVAVVEQPCAPRRPCPSNAAEAGELVMPGKRKRCCVCPTPHDIKSSDKGRMGKPVSSEQAHELLSTIPGAGGAEPWTSTDGDCYTFGSHVLMNTPGQLPAQRGDEIMACSAGYQARTSLHIKLQEDRALKRQRNNAAQAASQNDGASGSGVMNTVAQGSRGYSALQKEHDELRADHAKAVEAAAKAAAAAATQIKALQTKLHRTQADAS